MVAFTDLVPIASSHSHHGIPFQHSAPHVAGGQHGPGLTQQRCPSSRPAPGPDPARQLMHRTRARKSTTARPASPPARPATSPWMLTGGGRGSGRQRREPRPRPGASPWTVTGGGRGPGQRRRPGRRRRSRAEVGVRGWPAVGACGVGGGNRGHDPRRHPERWREEVGARASGVTLNDGGDRERRWACGGGRPWWRVVLVGRSTGVGGARVV